MRLYIDTHVRACKKIKKKNKIMKEMKNKVQKSRIIYKLLVIMAWD